MNTSFIDRVSERSAYRRSTFSKPFFKLKVTFCLLLLILNIGSFELFGQRAIQNPSVETPTFTTNSFHRISEGTLTGWLTTHPAGDCSFGPASCRPIERWGTGFNGFNAANGSGNAFVELNAEANSMIYQEVCMTQGESFTFSFLHRGRDSTSSSDVADFRIGIPSGLPSGSKPQDAYSYPILRVSTSSDGNPNNAAIPAGGSNTLTTNITNSNAGNGWRRYGGRYRYNGPTQVVNLGFAGVSTANGNVTVGNFIDDWQIQLSPYVEAAAQNTAAAEGSVGSSYSPPTGERPAVRISGSVPQGGATITVAVTGGTADLGTDFSLTPSFQSNNTNTSATISVPAGNYDGVNTGVYNLPFSTAANTVIQPHRTIEFTLEAVSGNVHLASLNACGQPPTINFSHTILDDDSPTSAGIPISGRVIEPIGRGVSGARITMMDLEGNIRYATTNPFGYFNLEGSNAGDTVIISVSSKRHTFAEDTQVFTLGNSLNDIVFVSN